MSERHIQIPVRLIRLPADLFRLYAIVRSFDWTGTGTGCIASIESLAKLAGKSARQLQRDLRRLEESGAVKVDKRKGDTCRIRCTPDMYWGDTYDTPGVTDLTPGGDTYDTGGVTLMTPGGGDRSDTQSRSIESVPDSVSPDYKPAPSNVSLDHKPARGDGEGGDRSDTPSEMGAGWPQGAMDRATAPQGQAGASARPSGPRTRTAAPPASPLPGRELRAHPRGIRNPPTWRPR